MAEPLTWQRGVSSMIVRISILQQKLQPQSLTYFRYQSNGADASYAENRYAVEVLQICATYATDRSKD